jgi:fumarate reductase subunit D
MTLDDRDIIQADATIIAGVLVLLTITFTFGTLKVSDMAQQVIRIFLTSVIIWPFALSAFFIVVENLQKEKRKEPFRRLSLGAMFIGFAVIILFFGMLMSFYVCPHCWK